MAGNRKKGRNLDKCKKYKAEGHQDKNKVRNVEKQKRIEHKAALKRGKRLLRHG